MTQYVIPMLIGINVDAGFLYFSIQNLQRPLTGEGFGCLIDTLTLFPHRSCSLVQRPRVPEVRASEARGERDGGDHHPKSRAVPEVVVVVPATEGATGAVPIVAPGAAAQHTADICSI